MLAQFSKENLCWPEGQVKISDPRGGVAPLRHDLALARYLEKQRAYRQRHAFEPSVRSFVPILQRLLNCALFVMSMHKPVHRSRFE